MFSVIIIKTCFNLNLDAYHQPLKVHDRGHFYQKNWPFTVNKANNWRLFGFVVLSYGFFLKQMHSSLEGRWSSGKKSWLFINLVCDTIQDSETFHKKRIEHAKTQTPLYNRLLDFKMNDE